MIKTVLHKFSAALPVRVLLVEDEPGDAHLVHCALRSSYVHCSIESVGTIAEFRQTLNKQEFNVILLDLSLPDSSGLDTLITVLQTVRNTPVIVLSGQGEMDFALSALETGAADYLVKGDFGHAGLTRAICYALLRKELEAGLVETSKKLTLAAHVVEAANESILITNADGVIESVNPAFTRITGFSINEVIGRTPQILHSGLQSGDFYKNLWKTLSRTGTWQGEIWNQRKDGTLYPQWISICSIKNPSGAVQHYVSIASDLTAIRQAEQDVTRLARFDPLTGLINRDSFHAELSLALATAKQEKFIAGVIILNLKRFRDINEARGMQAGDSLLKAVSTRTKENLHRSDILARLGADEFAIILPNLGASRIEAGRRALGIAERLSATLAQSFNVDNENYTIEAYFGINLFPQNPEQNAADILGNAQTALNRIKRGTDHPIAFFEHSMGETARSRYTLERDLRRGIADDQLRLYLQPQLNADNVIVGFEALVRWEHPEKGLVPPGEFIPLAEQSDLIVLLDTWMLKHACQLLTELTQQNRAVPIALNISPRHFARADLIPGIKQCLAETGTDPTLLILEVTEGLFLRDVDTAAAKMRELIDLGLRFSLDDFGTGYSALAYLKRLSFYELKIDQSFVRDLPHDQDDVALVETILAVARSLKLHVVAEGVETAEQAAFFDTRGPIVQQGYFHGRPEPAQNWLARLP
ncbi:MAG: EAL domain-containing protein [Methylococcales bacterium]|nr:EAL domain-containing protein [Methylococcales bacterium]